MSKYNGEMCRERRVKCGTDRPVGGAQLVVGALLLFLNLTFVPRVVLSGGGGDEGKKKFVYLKMGLSFWALSKFHFCPEKFFFSFG